MDTFVHEIRFRYFDVHRDTHYVLSLIIVNTNRQLLAVFFFFFGFFCSVCLKSCLCFVLNHLQSIHLNDNSNISRFSCVQSSSLLSYTIQRCCCHTFGLYHANRLTSISFIRFSLISYKKKRKKETKGKKTTSNITLTMRKILGEKKRTRA